MQKELEAAFKQSARHQNEVCRQTPKLQARGTIITLEGADSDYPLSIDQLTRYSRHRRSPQRRKWHLLTVQPQTEQASERAAIWVSHKYRNAFEALFRDYLEKFTKPDNRKKWETPEGNPRNRRLVANISRIQNGALIDLWTSEGEPEQNSAEWWEIWLDSTSQHVRSLEVFLKAGRLEYLQRSIELRDRSIFWVKARWDQLEYLPYTSVPIAEIRRASFLDTVEDLTVAERDEYVQDLVGRITPAIHAAPAVCLLDTGVYRAHTLIRDSLSPEDHHTIIGDSGNDVSKGGHGTPMAGLALYGNLDPILLNSNCIQLRHRLESVRITPGPGETGHHPLDFGVATIDAISTVEVANPETPRVYCLTLSTKPDNPGNPTLWSVAVDSLAVGTDITRQGEEYQLISPPDFGSARLILIAAGNVDKYEIDHYAQSDTSGIEDPAQAFNALTVGAFTNLDAFPTDPSYRGWDLLASKGELSPHSRTSVIFDQRNFPIKPDICMEGGNVLSDGEQMFDDRNSLLSLRSTGVGNDRALTSANATSAATAQAARLAALAMEHYPEFWPEAIRGLLVHRAEWTPKMQDKINAAQSKTQRLLHLRRYGWGTPTEASVLRSSHHSVTMVAQDQFLPFRGTEFLMQEFRLHTLPWPAEVLEQLGEEEVRLRITLSYFIEPAGSRRGWKQRYAYASHSLRFDLQGPLETREQFIDRINRRTHTPEGNSSRTGSTTDRWLIGPNQRNNGSLHQDEWRGAGVALAQCNSVAVYPVGGWWKNNRHAGRRDIPIRYALLLSLTTEKQGIDLYTPIAEEIQVPVHGKISAR